MFSLAFLEFSFQIIAFKEEEVKSYIAVAYFNYLLPNNSNVSMLA